MNEVIYDAISRIPDSPGLDSDLEACMLSLHLWQVSAGGHGELL